ncbi:hypothetical protein ACO0LF_14400 [Undibacterium sp. Di27W]|uniref:hypothetical protein n=1 Tax=Undibacterium sp. Di27W TaxID=3413036 RepID=UPI003BF2879E
MSLKEKQNSIEVTQPRRPGRPPSAVPKTKSEAAAESRKKRLQKGRRVDLIFDEDDAKLLGAVKEKLLALSEQEAIKQLIRQEAKKFKL